MMVVIWTLDLMFQSQADSFTDLLSAPYPEENRSSLIPRPPQSEPPSFPPPPPLDAFQEVELYQQNSYQQAEQVKPI